MPRYPVALSAASAIARSCSADWADMTYLAEVPTTKIGSHPAPKIGHCRMRSPRQRPQRCPVACRFLVGVAGFEPAASSSRTEYSGQQSRCLTALLHVTAVRRQASRPGSPRLTCVGLFRWQDRRRRGAGQFGPRCVAAGICQLFRPGGQGTRRPKKRGRCCDCLGVGRCLGNAGVAGIHAGAGQGECCCALPARRGRPGERWFRRAPAWWCRAGERAVMRGCLRR